MNRTAKSTTCCLGRMLRRLAVVAALAIAAAARAAEPLIFAVHPYLAASEIDKRFAPLARHLIAALGRDIVIRIPRDYEEHIQAVGRDESDIAFIGPAGLVAVEAAHGPHPLLGRLEVAGRPELRGHIVVRRDSTLTRLADLRGKRMAFGDPQSTMSTLVPRAILARAGITDRDFSAIRHLGSHDNIAAAVLAGEFDAGAIKDETYDRHSGRGLRSLEELPAVSDHAFVASRRLPAATVEQLRTLLADLRNSEHGRAILTGIQPNLTGIVPATSGDYDSLRRLLKGPERRREGRRP